jgi:hypothetical protein
MPDVNATQLRDALAWTTNAPEPIHEASSNPFVWFWEAVEGDFNENRTTAQILVDAGISMIPLVDQICDVRDLIADCKKLTHDFGDKWAWAALVLTLIGLFPTLGSLVKGVLKIFFAFVRRSGGTAIKHTVAAGMTWVITFLRRREVQLFLRSKNVDEVFQWLATEVKSVRGKIDPTALTAVFDRGIKVLENLANRVSLVPIIGSKAKNALEQVKKVRLMADKHLSEALRPVHEIVHEIILALERQILEKQHGILNTTNVHFRGVIPESQAVALMRKRKPKFVSSTGDRLFVPVQPRRAREMVDDMSAKFDTTGRPRPPAEQFPTLSNQTIASFHLLETHVIRGPARMYRILSPSSRAMSECWVSEEIFRKLQSAPDPKAAWHRHLGVWPDWNANGQFVIFDVKAGETLNAWKGPAASQTKKSLPNQHLEGGWEQIVFNLPAGDKRADTMKYYKKKGATNSTLGTAYTQSEVDTLVANMNPKQKTLFFENHLAIRESINHPSISGPFETGWGYTEFDGAGFSGRVGLPELPGQVTNSGRQK